MAFSSDIKDLPRNKDIEDIEDINKERVKVKRTDGVATIDDMAELLGKKVPGDDENQEECSEEKSDSLNKFIEIIIKVER